MIIYGELDPLPKHKAQLVFKDKREDIDKLNIPNIEYSNQHIDVEIPYGSRDCS